MSACLATRGIDHVVLERGQIGERWRSERWESLRLLTPNWQTRLPGWSYDGPDPDDFMSAAEVVEFLERYARACEAPVEPHTAVHAVKPDGAGFVVQTDRGDWRARALVVATGYSDLPRLPHCAGRLSSNIDQITPDRYRRPSQVRAGGVLIIGAAATGVQLADELAAAGHRVLLSAGYHMRVPRTYRGRDILWWLERLGIFDEQPEDVFDHDLSRDQSSFQLIGRRAYGSIDLGTLQTRGVEILGRMAHIDGPIVEFTDNLITTTVAADLKLAKLFQRIDRFVAANPDSQATDPTPFEPLWPRFMHARTRVDLEAEGIGTVIWATGYRRAYPWLGVPGLIDAGNEIRHSRGVTVVPGIYVLGLQFLRHRNSSFIDGVGRDAQALADHLQGLLKSSEASPRIGGHVRYGSASLVGSVGFAPPPAGRES